MKLEINFPIEHISEGLQKAREYRGISLKETANLVGITSSALSSYEKGKTFPTLPVMESLSFIYHIPLNILISPDAVEDFTSQPDAEQMQQLIKVRQSILSTTLQIAFEDSGLSQKALVKAAGISRSKVKRYLEGDAIPVDDLKKISKALGMEFSQHIDRESQIGLWQISQAVYERFAALPENIKEFIFETDNWDFINTAYALHSLDPNELETLIHSLAKLREIMFHKS